MFCLSVVDPKFVFNHVEDEKFQNVRTYNTSRTQKSITRKSDGRKSSVPRKLSVYEDENVGEKTGYSILGSYLNSCKTQGQAVTSNNNPSDLPEVGTLGM